MDVRSIRTETDYAAALAEIERLFDAAPNTPEGDRLKVLVTLVEAYEAQHYTIPAPDPVEAIKYYMESRGLSRGDLEPYIRKSRTCGRGAQSPAALIVGDDSTVTHRAWDSGGSSRSTLRCGQSGPRLTYGPDFNWLNLTL